MKLKEYLESKGIMQSFFAKKIGVSNTTLYEILKNGLLPSLRTAIAIEKETDGAVTLYDWVVEDAPNASTTEKKKNKKKE